MFASGGAAIPFSAVLRHALTALLLVFGALRLLRDGMLRGRKRILSTQVTADGRTVQFRSLLDTGNLLRDPLTGGTVLLADHTVAERLLQIGRTQLAQPTELLRRLTENKPELSPRLIPFRTVSAGHGLLLGIRCTELRIGGRQQKSTILAFSTADFSSDGSFHGLTGGRQ